MEPTAAGSSPGLVDLSSEWVDLYAILDVAPDADAETIRKRISVRTSEAVGNSNHRDSKRREYYQALSQQILPQSRRVLLNPAFRAAYDQQRASHLAGSAGALSYRSFLNTLSEEGIATAAAPVSESAAVAEPVIASSVPEVEAFPVTPPTVAAEITAAAEPVHASAATTGSAKPTPAMPDDEDDIPVVPIIPKDRPLLTPIEEPTAEKPVVAARKKAPPKVAASTTSRVAPRTATQGPAATHPAEAAPNEFVQPQKRVSYSYAPRVVIDDAAAAPHSKNLFRPGERALSDTSIALLTAIVATMLSITIDLYSEPGTFMLSATILFLLPRLRPPE